MTAAAFVIPDKARLALFSGTLAGATFKLALVASTWAPANATDEVFADVTGELATGFGYTAGGTVLTGVTLTQTAGIVKFTASPVVFTAAGGSIPAWRRGVVYCMGTVNGKVNPLIGHFLGDGSPADVPATTAGNTTTVTMNTLGIIGTA